VEHLELPIQAVEHLELLEVVEHLELPTRAVGLLAVVLLCLKPNPPSSSGMFGTSGFGILQPHLFGFWGWYLKPTLLAYDLTGILGSGASELE
jgi:hypothetical protein